MNKRDFFFSGCLVLIGIFTFCERGHCADVEFLSRSYLHFFEDTGDNKHAPFYEYIELNVKNLKERKLSLYSGGWFRYDLKARSTIERELDELSYAFLRYAPFEDRSLIFNIGRERVVEGVMVGLVDGLYGRWEITPRTGLSLFGGRPVETEFDGKRGDLIYGGRIFQRLERKAEIGLSFLKEDNDGSRYREEFGLDLWLSPLKRTEVLGRSFFNNVTHGWSDHAYTLRVFPLEALVLSGLFSHTDYTDAFSASTLSVFSPEFLGRGETLTKKGGSAEYRIGRDVTLTADYINYGYTKSGDANFYGGQIAVRNYDARAGLSLHRMDGGAGKLRYTELRLYGKKSIDPVALAVDAITLHYDTPFNGLSTAYSVYGTIEYPITRSLNAGLSAEFRKTPDFSHDTRVLARLAYAVRKR